MYRLIGSTHTLTGLPGATSHFLRALDSVRKTIGDEAGLSASELRVMGQIAETDGITPKYLADVLEMSTGAITAITTALVARDLVRRTEKPEDRRSLLLSLTEDGHALMDQTYRRFQAAITHASSHLDEQTRRATIEALEKLTADLRAEHL